MGNSTIIKLELSIVVLVFMVEHITIILF